MTIESTDFADAGDYLIILEVGVEDWSCAPNCDANTIGKTSV